jgi:antitoxin CptB
VTALTQAEAPAVRRLRWRCRRGMKELDVVLERFARSALASTAAEEPAALEELLDLPDPQLAAYLLGGEHPCEPHLARLAERIRSLCRSAAPAGGILPASTG